MRIKLSDHFSYGKLLRFTLPSIAMMVFTSIYGVVDGYFVSNFAGKTPFAAVNLVMPVLMIMGTVSFMFGSGGTALVAKTYGEGEQDRANRYFSLIVYIAFAVGVVLTIMGFILIRPIAVRLGAEGQLLESCVRYARIVLVALPLFSMMRVASYCTAQGLANEYIGGVSFMQWLNRTLEAGEDALKELLNTMRGILERLVTKERLTVSCSEATPDAAIDVLIAAIPSDGVEPKAEACYRPSGSRQEGIVIPSQVGFAVTGTNLQLHDRVYTGSIPVLSKLLSFTYLWNEIRVKGGAYGCGFNGRDTGELFFYTYRDPQPDRSLNVIAESAAYVRSFLANDPDLTGFILSAVSTLDPLRTAEDKITASEARFFRGMTGEYIIERYRALIGTNREDLLRLCDVLDEIAKDNDVCVIAGESALDACGEKIKDRVTV